MQQGGIWVGEPLHDFHGVLSGTPMIMDSVGRAQFTAGPQQDDARQLRR